MDGQIKIGDTVKWSTSRKPIGVVILKFEHKGKLFAVVESATGALQVVRVYENLLVA